MNNFEQQFASYSERNRFIQRRFLANTKLNTQMFQTSSNHMRNKSQNRAIKVRELKNSSLSYACHMNWLYHPYD